MKKSQVTVFWRVEVNASNRISRHVDFFEKSTNISNPSSVEPQGPPLASIGFRATQADVLPGMPRSAICVQRFDDSLNSAIHTTYRTLLRSSSMHKPRDPSS